MSKRRLYIQDWLKRKCLVVPLLLVILSVLWIGYCDRQGYMWPFEDRPRRLTQEEVMFLRSFRPTYERIETQQEDGGELVFSRIAGMPIVDEVRNVGEMTLYLPGGGVIRANAWQLRADDFQHHQWGLSQKPLHEGETATLIPAYEFVYHIEGHPTVTNTYWLVCKY